MNAMWHDPASSRLMFRLNLAMACLCALESLFLSSAYDLYMPHIVGHYIPAVSVVVVVLYGLHCALLYWTDHGLRRPWEFNALSLPFAGAAVSAWICYQRYFEQL
jgi:hypothetical protein